MLPTQKINWPAAIKHDNDPELTFLKDQSSFHQLSTYDLDITDTLIDSSGQQFAINIKDDTIKLIFKNTILLNDFLGLVKAHAANTGSCCVAKLYAPSHQEAFQIIQSLSDD